MTRKKEVRGKERFEESNPFVPPPGSPCQQRDGFSLIQPRPTETGVSQ